MTYERTWIKVSCGHRVPCDLPIVPKTHKRESTYQVSERLSRSRLRDRIEREVTSAVCPACMAVTVSFNWPLQPRSGRLPYLDGAKEERRKSSRVRSRVVKQGLKHCQELRRAMEWSRRPQFSEKLITTIDRLALFAQVKEAKWWNRLASKKLTEVLCVTPPQVDSKSSDPTL